MTTPLHIGDAALYQGDCLAVLVELADNSVDAVVTDPPYGLAFMGKRWDYDVPDGAIWAECLRVLKPGGHLLAFAGTRTQHRMAIRIEDAGFEIRDMIAWVYGSGFPKSLSVDKAIDKEAGAEREVVGPNRFASVNGKSNLNTYGIASRPDETAPATPAARQWQGWGTALKPSFEPVTLARKPFPGTVAANVLAHGTGALNVDGCRVGTDVETWPKTRSYHASRGPKPRGAHGTGDGQTISTGDPPAGRFPANLIHDGSAEVVGLFPETNPSPSAPVKQGGHHRHDVGLSGVSREGYGVGYGDNGSAARFFYCAKASKDDRDDGCEGLEGGVIARSCQAQAEAARGNVVDCEEGAFNKARRARNHHPTVKPTALMRYLCRLVTPPGGVVLDPFMGSGSTGLGAWREGFRFIGIEREAEYFTLAIHRLRAAQRQPDLFHEAGKAEASSDLEDKHSHN